MAFGDKSTHKILIVRATRSKTSNQGEMIRAWYNREDRIERTSVWFGSRNQTLPEAESLIGKVYEATFEETNYAGAVSDKILMLNPLEGEDVSKFERRSELDFDAVIARFKSLMAGDELMDLLNRVLFDNQFVLERFKTWPAAKGFHHAFPGGLYEHTAMMVNLAVAIMDTDVSCRGIDRGVVIAATILHDVGKVKEYECEPGKDVKFSNLGCLIGHMCLADEFIVRSCAKIPANPQAGRIAQVRHCVLSHHGKQEWGSPVEPCTREAVLLHHIDLLQSRNQLLLEITEGLEVGGRGKRDFKGPEYIRWK